MSKRILAGVDIGGTKTAVVLSSQPPSTLTRLMFPTKPEGGPQPAIENIVESLRTALASQGLTAKSLQAIGISCGGPLDPVSGVVQAPPNLATWKDVPITTILSSEFGVKCYLENDANAGALAEHSFGSGYGLSNLIFLTMGTGFGAGFILNGELYRGTTHLAGEVGHVRLTRTGPRGFNKVGSVEGWISGAGVARVARIRVAAARTHNRSTQLTSAVDDHGELTALDVSLAAAAGDALAQGIIRDTGRKLGETLAILIDLLNPEVIAVGGLAVRLGEALLGPARAIVKRDALATSARACRIVPAALGEQIGDVAALCVAVEGEKHGK